jgi:hypothetical protein
LGAIAGLRPNARLLAARSLLMRMGRVDRQPLRAMAAAIGIAAAGDLIHLLNSRPDWALSRATQSAGNLLIAVGSMLLTVGLVGVLLDTLRLVPVLVRPPLSIGKVMGRASGPGGAA